jgi:hypothetical protein
MSFFGTQSEIVIQITVVNWVMIRSQLRCLKNDLSYLVYHAQLCLKCHQKLL